MSVIRRETWPHVEIAPHISLGQHGTTINTAKLTEANVIEILRRSAHGETGVALAREFGVRQSNISFIVRRKTWKHVTWSDTTPQSGTPRPHDPLCGEREQRASAGDHTLP